jgi:hypothetical protein
MSAMDYPLSTSKSQDEPEDRLCLIQDEEQTGEPQIICSLGLARESA